MPGHARLWIYKSAVPLTAEQQGLIRARGEAFAETWAAHGAPLLASVDVLNDHFVMVAVDEEQARASGCSIDSSVRFIQRLERELGLSLTDRMVVLYEKAGIIRSCRVPQVEGALKSGELDADTIVFDDLVSTVHDLRARFRVPLRESWMARFL